MSSAADLLALPALPMEFYLDGTVTVAKALLGKALVSTLYGDLRVGEIVETEAYLGGADAASHAFRGETVRNQTMFRHGGLCYVYLSYGINHCMNVVTGADGSGEAVLIRALAPLYGVEAMAKARGIALNASRAKLLSLTNGPGKLTQAYGIDRAHDGLSFLSQELRIVDLSPLVGKRQLNIKSSRRIGITKAAELPYRFFVADSPWVSRRALPPAATL